MTDLLDGAAEVRAELVTGLGFDAHDAIQVLTAVHKIQQDQLNDRGEDFADALNDLRNSAQMATHQEGQGPGEPSDELKAK